MAEALYAAVDSKLDTELAQLRIENEQLRYALSSRIVIEQAKGMLAERFGLPLDAAFFALRGGARSSQRSLHDLAHEVVSSTETPPAVVAALQRIRP